MDTVTNRQILDASLPDWRKLAQGLHARFLVGDLVTGAAFVGAVAEAAEAAVRRPEVTLRHGHVDIVLSTHRAGRWVTARDLDLAATITGLARARGLEPRPDEVTQLELALDTADDDRVGPFWSALLTGDPDNRVHDSVLDPSARVPVMWFQGTDPHETPRQRWHVDLWLAPEAAAARIAGAVAAGGTVVSTDGAPSFTVLADPDGNLVCVCTSAERD